MKLLLALAPMILLAQDAQVQAKPEHVPDPITDKMRFDFAVAQRDYLNIKVQEATATGKLETMAGAIKVACEGSGMAYNPQLSQFGCSPKEMAGVDPRINRKIAKADQRAGIPPEGDAAEQRKKQLADAKKKKDEEEAKNKQAEAKSATKGN